MTEEQEAKKVMREMGAVGGKARAEKLTPERRKEIARAGAQQRWHGIPVAVCGSLERPLRIADVEIPCYVLDDGRRILSERGVVSGMGMKRGGRDGGDRLTHWMDSKSIGPFISASLRAAITTPILFRNPKVLTKGYEAGILLDICDAVLEARKQGKLVSKQEHIADRCELLVRGISRVGIVALVDEATGYQEMRTKDALAKILEAFIDKELQRWTQTFPSDFYQELFRLRGLSFPNDSVKRPQYFGWLTNDIVYKRLAPGVLEELRRINPKDESGRRKSKHFQWLTRNIGYPGLREHLGAVVAIMKLSSDWQDFLRKLNSQRPRLDGPSLPLFPDDDGGGL